MSGYKSPVLVSMFHSIYDFPEDHVFYKMKQWATGVTPVKEHAKMLKFGDYIIDNIYEGDGSHVSFLITNHDLFIATASILPGNTGVCLDMSVDFDKIEYLPKGFLQNLHNNINDYQNYKPSPFIQRFTKAWGAHIATIRKYETEHEIDKISLNHLHKAETLMEKVYNDYQKPFFGINKDILVIR